MTATGVMGHVSAVSAIGLMIACLCVPPRNAPLGAASRTDETSYIEDAENIANINLLQVKVKTAVKAKMTVQPDAPAKPNTKEPEGPAILLMDPWDGMSEIRAMWHEFVKHISPKNEEPNLGLFATDSTRHAPEISLLGKSRPETFASTISLSISILLCILVATALWLNRFQLFFEVCRILTCGMCPVGNWFRPDDKPSTAARPGILRRGAMVRRAPSVQGNAGRTTVPGATKTLRWNGWNSSNQCHGLRQGGLGIHEDSDYES